MYTHSFYRVFFTFLSLLSCTKHVIGMDIQRLLNQEENNQPTPKKKRYIITKKLRGNCTLTQFSMSKGIDRMRNQLAPTTEKNEALSGKKVKTIETKKSSTPTLVQCPHPLCNNVIIDEINILSHNKHKHLGDFIRLAMLCNIHYSHRFPWATQPARKLSQYDCNNCKSTLINKNIFDAHLAKGLCLQKQQGTLTLPDYLRPRFTEG